MLTIDYFHRFSSGLLLYVVGCSRYKWFYYIFIFFIFSNVVTMALQMSPVDAHPWDQSHCHYQPTELQIQSTGSNCLVELSQCQLPIEQVPLPTVFYLHFFQFLLTLQVIIGF